MDDKIEILKILKEENPLTLPDGYFDNLPGQIDSKIDQLEEKPIIRMPDWKSYGRWVAAASIALLLMSSVVYFASSERKSLRAETTTVADENTEYREALYSQLEDETLIEYLTSED